MLVASSAQCLTASAAVSPVVELSWRGAPSPVSALHTKANLCLKKQMYVTKRKYVFEKANVNCKGTYRCRFEIEFVFEKANLCLSK